MTNFNWEEFKKGNIIVNCSTKKKANDFLKKCHDNGMTWIDGDSIDINNCKREYCKKDTCYGYNKGIHFFTIEFYDENKNNIIKW